MKNKFFVLQLVLVVLFVGLLVWAIVVNLNQPTFTIYEEVCENITYTHYFEQTDYSKEIKCYDSKENEIKDLICYDEGIASVNLTYESCEQVEVEKFEPCKDSSKPILLQRWCDKTLTLEWLEENCECVEDNKIFNQEERDKFVGKCNKRCYMWKDEDRFIECFEKCSPYKYFDYDEFEWYKLEPCQKYSCGKYIVEVEK